MTRLYQTLALVTALLFTAMAPAAPDDIDGGEIIDRVSRVLRVSPETAQTWHAGVASLDTWPARLERALLETLGPQPLRNPDRALRTLENLAVEHATGVRISDEARETLTVIVQLIDRVHSHAREHARAAQALEEEREAHRETLDKLKALRAIDHQIDERQDNGGR